MRILAVESSCDDTAAAVLEDGAVRSSVVASQDDVHSEYGGVVPELASRSHIRAITPTIARALADAGATLDDIDAVAATFGPGLVGSLLVGLCAAKAIAYARRLPFIGVNHLEGHLLSVQLERRVEFPYVALLVSGGHTSLYLARALGDYELLGSTRDDAAGEAFDKVAKLLGLGYPGGPIIDKVAKTGNDRAYDLPRVKITHRDRNPPPGPAGIRPAGFEKALEHRADFSFSGLKTAVLRIVQQREGRPFSESEMADLCADEEILAGVEAGADHDGNCAVVELNAAAEVFVQVCK